MARENKTKYVLLGLLLDATLTGYEMREIVGQPFFYFWHETDASIYPTLKLLVKQKFVKPKTLYTGKRRKVAYTITDAGKKEFHKWLPLPVEIDRRRSEFFLKLYFATDAMKNQVTRQFEARLRMFQDLLEAFKRDAEKMQKEHPKNSFCMKPIENGIAHFELEISWLEKQLQSTFK